MRRAPTRALAALVLPFALGCDERGTGVVSGAEPGPGWASLGPGVSSFRETRTDSSGANVSWVVVRVDLDAVRVRAMELAKRRLDAIGDYRAALFAVNGGFFEPDFTPSGLLIEDGRVVSDWRERGGSGALLVRARRASIVSEDPGDTTSIELAVQCGPRLVEPGGAMGIQGDDGKRAERTAACVRQGGKELNFVVAVGPTVPGDGPTLHQLAQWLTRPLSPGEAGGCEAALNLDGGPSTGVVARKFSRQEMVAPRGPVPWALVGIQR